MECRRCSGRYDEYGVTVPHDDDTCRCTEGILQARKKTGDVVQVRLTSNPFKGKVQHVEKTQDERDWDAYVSDLQEKYQDPDYNPIEIS